MEDNIIFTIHPIKWLIYPVHHQSWIQSDVVQTTCTSSCGSHTFISHDPSLEAHFCTCLCVTVMFQWPYVSELVIGVGICCTPGHALTLNHRDKNATLEYHLLYMKQVNCSLRRAGIAAPLYVYLHLTLTPPSAENHDTCFYYVILRHLWFQVLFSRFRTGPVLVLSNWSTCIKSE